MCAAPCWHRPALSTATSPGRKSEDLVQPLVPYAASKRMVEQWLQLYAVAYGMETVVLRYSSMLITARSAPIHRTAASSPAGAMRRLPAMLPHLWRRQPDPWTSSPFTMW